jgi:hypothetical protein
MYRNIFLAVSLFVSGLAGGASAGVVVTSTQTNLDTHQASTLTAYIEADRLKLVIPEATVVYRSDLDRLWVIDMPHRSYVEVTPQTMQQMGQLAGLSVQLNAAQSQLQAQLSQLPPEQRAQIEALMGAVGGAGAASGPPQVTFMKTGGSKVIAGWKCDLYRKTVNGQQEAEICLAPISVAELRPSDLQVMERFSNFIAPVMSSPLMPHLADVNWNELSKAAGFEGLPLDTLVYAHGKPDLEETIKSVERTTISPRLFELPAGLAKRDVGSLLQGRS